MMKLSLLKRNLFSHVSIRKLISLFSNELLVHNDIILD